MSNYSASPSMEEILDRIKIALRKRKEQEVGSSSLKETSNISLDDNISIKPVVGNNDNIFKLKKEMKCIISDSFIPYDINIKKENIKKFFHLLSVKIIKDLNLSLYPNQVEQWFNDNFYNVSNILK